MTTCIIIVGKTSGVNKRRQGWRDEGGGKEREEEAKKGTKKGRNRNEIRSTSGSAEVIVHLISELIIPLAYYISLPG